MKNAIWIGFVLVVIGLGILGYLNFKKNFLIDQKNAKIETQLEENKKLVAKVDSLTKARKDSIVTIDNYIYVEEKKKEDAKVEVENTTNVDSVIANYEAYRPGKSGMIAIDSNNINVGKDEVKFITGKFIDLNFLNNIKVPGLEEQIGILKRICTDRDAVISLKENSINLLMDEVENLTPTFWDKVLKWLIIIGSFGVGYLLGA
ncbi:MAG: hypothetical protein M0P61_00530 [Ignavibacteriaceae bacterium]|jgi:uncharacterized membrane protein (Fun14 family)|nr:hypothetical protein [Ignavibacteriaceae bacterium]